MLDNPINWLNLELSVCHVNNTLLIQNKIWIIIGYVAESHNIHDWVKTLNQTIVGIRDQFVVSFVLFDVQ